MKKNLAILSALFLLRTIITAQPIPPDSLYLGQTPPGNTPVIFNLDVNTGSFAAERIAISSDNKEIYYSEVHTYYPISGDTIKCYRYSGNHWTGPFNVFQNYLAPGLSVNSDTLYFQSNSTTYESYFSVRNGANWTTPQRLLANLNSAHYLQVTDNWHYYISSISSPTVGASDWCRLNIGDPDTTAVSLGLPVNSGGNNLDFFVSRDESFMILAKGGLKISYHKTDGSWTNPKSLGAQINFGLNMWGPWVTADNKYLFYTTGTQQNYSDTYIYWVRVDDLIDSLMYTNYVPYVKNPIPDQTAIIGEFYNYTLTDTTFIDDDGNNTLSFGATLTNGNPLPSWLTFDTATVTFSGTPTAIETLNIRVTATDTAGESVSETFKLAVTPHTSSGQLNEKNNAVRIFPNPTSGLFNISSDAFAGTSARVEIMNSQGKVILTQPFRNDMSICLSGQPAGIYFIHLSDNQKTISTKVVLLSK